MWIAGGNKPDFRTINRFRLQMKDIIEDIFYEVVKLLMEKDYIKMRNYFLDGTKIEVMPISIPLSGVEASTTILSDFWIGRRPK